MLLSKRLSLAVISLFIETAGAQAQVGSETGQTPATAMKANSPETTSQSAPSTNSFYFGAFGGPINVKTTVTREVDKKGTLFGLGIGGRYYFTDAFIGGELGYLVSSVKGSSAMTTGDQTARIKSPYLDVNLGYRFTPSVSAAFGLQSWLNEGSNFSPEDDAEKNKLYYYVSLEFQPDLTHPLSFNLRYLKDLNVQDRNVSAVTAGILYQLPL